MKAYERLLKYVMIDTTSNEATDESVCPSSPNEKVLATQLVSEMKKLGIADARCDDNSYIYGTIPSTTKKSIPIYALIAHMDTSPSSKGSDIKPQIIRNFDGKDIILNKQKSIFMRTSEYESLNDYLGDDLIVTDGTTLLGADDKAGIAEILTCVERLCDEKIEHGEIKIAFTPDEEIGRGADKFNVKELGADFGYTVDGGKLGEIEYENFNAAVALIDIHGINIHPGEGKNKMKNASLIAFEFNSMLPSNEIPSTTENYEGFQHLVKVNGSEELACLEYIIRDHDKDKFIKKKELFLKTAKFLNLKYGEKTCKVVIKDQYYNMKSKIEPHMFLIDNAKNAMREAGVSPKVVPIRGGTDGARLSYMGLPCPNLSTGGHNFHSRFEYIPIQSMEKMTDVLINLIKAK